ncbi:hypothetical protein Aph01nite_47000 [Acrocarpospora phusangensis]|uniref:Uncharacterized protein n=1 Tax=Acrocarpospora phusangensis TaxID=1070424 RepID=A0A919USF3_9ACTN|nr:hypothetical protein [Acrocarpospora phusangensis]GIH26390.1 hypothetical protein Aph01nite_47000 [Acrocarpospora phusangensis]
MDPSVDDSPARLAAALRRVLACRPGAVEAVSLARKLKEFTVELTVEIHTLPDIAARQALRRLRAEVEHITDELDTIQSAKGT